MPRLLSLPLLALLTLATGCDNDDSLLGEFVGRDVVGGASRLVEGEAVYTVVETATGPEFVLGLFVGDLYDSDFDEYDYVLFRRPGDRPGVGAYAIDDDPVRAFSATLARAVHVDDAGEIEDDAFMGAALAGTDGTLALSRVDAYGFVLGSYDFRAEGVRLAPRAGRVTGAASGTFEARYEPPSTFRRLGLDLGV